MKLVTIEAFFPELKGNPYETAKGKAGSVPNAMKRATQNLWAKDRIRGKKITTVKMTITIVNVVPTEKTVWFVMFREGVGLPWKEVTKLQTGAGNNEFSTMPAAWDWIHANISAVNQTLWSVGKKKVPVEQETAGA